PSRRKRRHARAIQPWCDVLRRSGRAAGLCGGRKMVSALGRAGLCPGTIQSRPVVRAGRSRAPRRRAGAYVVQSCYGALSAFGYSQPQRSHQEPRYACEQDDARSDRAGAEARARVASELGRLIRKHGDGADWAAGAAPDLEREADELEAALADQLLHSDEPLDVRKAHDAADVMDLKIVAPRSARAHAFDPEHLDLLAAEPAG